MPYNLENLRNTFGGTFGGPIGGGGGGARSVVRGPGGSYGLGGGGGLAGATPRGGSDAAGRIPGVTDPTKTVLGDLGNIGGIISGITDQQLESLRKQYPTEYFATLQQLLLNTQRRAGGDISDLLPELQTRNAEAGIAGGYSGSGMENTKLLRDLGLTRYGVEQQALKDIGLIKEGFPTVKPYDPTGVIQGLIDAQARADLYAAAPDPEAAYQRARRAAGGAGGGGGGGGGLPRYGGGGGGGGGGTVDDILKRYGGGGYGPPIIARGTRQGELPDADWNPITFGPMGNYSSGGGGMPLSDWEEFGIFGDIGEDAGMGGGGGFGAGGADYGDYEDEYGGGGNYDWMYDPFSTGGGGYEDYGGGGGYEDYGYEDEYF